MTAASFAAKRSQIRQSGLQSIQSALPKFARLAVGEINQVSVSNGQYPRPIRQVETLPKFRLGRIDCIQVVHFCLRRAIDLNHQTANAKY